MEVQGEIAIGEASRYTRPAARRLNGFPGASTIYLIVMFVLTALLLIIFGTIRSLAELPSWTWAPAVLGILWASISAGLRACRWRGLQIARKAFAKRGLVNPVPSRFAVKDASFVTGVGRVTSHASWDAVSDLLPSGPYWVVLIEGGAHYLPKRFFASIQEEKAFIRGMLERMLPDARARSGDAVSFVAEA